jgi:hypothetical protein
MIHWSDTAYELPLIFPAQWNDTFDGALQCAAVTAQRRY